MVSVWQGDVVNLWRIQGEKMEFLEHAGLPLTGGIDRIEKLGRLRPATELRLSPPVSE